MDRIVNDELTDPKSVVISFAAEYSAWERAMNASDDPFINSNLKIAHAAILSRYCTAKERKFVDDANSFSDPPLYELISEGNIYRTEFVNAKRAYVDTKNLVFNAYRFVLLLTADGWRIDCVKRSHGSEWKNTLIGSN